jgi:hypothetical protein
MNLATLLRVDVAINVAGIITAISSLFVSAIALRRASAALRRTGRTVGSYVRPYGETTQRPLE